MFFKRKQKRTEHPAGRDPRVGPSILTSEVVIEGKVMTAGELQIDGTIHGDVRAGALVVDARGIVHGEVIAEEVVVRGRIIGPIRGIHVHIFSGAHVEGDVIHETISIENGAFVEGNIHRADNPLEQYGADELSRPLLYDDQPAEPLDDRRFRPAGLLRPGSSGAAE